MESFTYINRVSIFHDSYSVPLVALFRRSLIDQPIKRQVPSQRNQSIDLRCKSFDWFLYDRNFGL